MSGEGAYVSTREAAELLGISLRTAQLWVESGVLLAWKTSGGHRRIMLHSVEKILAERKRYLSTFDTNSENQFKVMLVEDDPDLLKLLEMTVRSHNEKIAIYSAQDGFVGMIKIGEFKPHLLITDLNMPNMDGFQMLRSIEGTEFAPKAIIVTTVLNQEQILDKGGLPANVAVLEKPFNLSRLNQLLENFLPASN